MRRHRTLRSFPAGARRPPRVSGWQILHTGAGGVGIAPRRALRDCQIGDRCGINVNGAVPMKAIATFKFSVRVVA